MTTRRRAPLAGLRAGFYGAVVTLTDLLPPRIRYGYVHRITRAVFRRDLPAMPAAVDRRMPLPPPAGRQADVCCAVLADHLDIGGIGSVVEMLALHLPEAGVRPVIVCRGDGERATRLRDAGVEVHSVTGLDEARSVLAALRADVLQLHSAPGFLERAAQLSGTPLVTVMHNTEIHYTPARWREYTELMGRSALGIAVSETVGRFHARRLDDSVAARIRVIPNGAPAFAPANANDRRAARAALERAISTPIGEDVVFVCLARYDSQKNIAGLVGAFASAAAARPGIRLVCAGDPSDWAELLRARAIADRDPSRDRVHLIGNSDAATLLTAADGFVLDSFFEGWPVAATEAAAAGLPLLLSETGGAAELVARDPARSEMVPNPAGDAAGITDALVGRYRRCPDRQINTSALAVAFVRAADGAAGERPPAADEAGVAAMIDAHAAALREAATGLSASV